MIGSSPNRLDQVVVSQKPIRDDDYLHSILLCHHLWLTAHIAASFLFVVFSLMQQRIIAYMFPILVGRGEEDRLRYRQIASRFALMAARGATSDQRCLQAISTLNLHAHAPSPNVGNKVGRGDWSCACRSLLAPEVSQLCKGGSGSVRKVNLGISK